MIRLLTLSRIQPEKGFKRMAVMQDLIKEPFVWDIYGSGNLDLLKPLTKCNYKGVTNEAKEVMRQYDFLVQLSDTEGMPMVILEALSVGLPVITTNYPSAKELITHGVNGYIVDFDLKNLPELKILPTFTFINKSTVNDWLKIL
jgi:glycosyltransferase involved in cell wall biosynthesis